MLTKCELIALVPQCIKSIFQVMSVTFPSDLKQCGLFELMVTYLVIVNGSL